MTLVGIRTAKARDRNTRIREAMPMQHQRNHCTSGENCTSRQTKNAHSSAKDTRYGKDFIPNQVAPDNWPFFEARCNPLCSKGINGTDEDFYDK